MFGNHVGFKAMMEVGDMIGARQEVVIVEPHRPKRPGEPNG
jgi:hypothetical protein